MNLHNNKWTHFVLATISVIVTSEGYAQNTPPAYPANTQVNFVRTWDAVAPEQNENVLITRPLKDVRQSTTYSDGLGRPIQKVMKQGSLLSGSPNPISNDLVLPSVYDESGNEQYQYLGFVANNTGGNTSVNDGAFKLNPFQQQQTFMLEQYGSQGETYYYSQTNFEASPLNRALKKFAPGNSWVGSRGTTNEKGVAQLHLLNTVNDEVKIFTIASGVGSIPVNTGNYPANELNKTIIIDEHNKQTVEFRDKEGNIILRKVQLDNTVTNGHTGWLCTYYIYDDLNQLRFVLSPKATELFLLGSSLTSIKNELCFVYEYDINGRMIIKKAPGSDEIWSVYDTRDRLVMAQDANMRAQNKWMYTSYDELNRPVSYGLITDPVNYNNLNYHLNAAYNSSAYPSLSSYSYEELGRNFYDNYLWLTNYGNPLSSNYNNSYDTHFQAISNNWPYAQGNVQSQKIRGLITGNRIKILGTNNTYLYSINIYDEKAQVIQKKSTNISGGIDVTTIQYTWAGQPLIMVQKQDKQGINAQTTVLVTQIAYDDLGRPIKLEKKLSNTLVNNNLMSDYKTIAINEYDQMGQLKKKILGNNLETLTYDYNIRGWALGTNRDYVKDVNNSNYFGFDLGYDKANNNIIGNQTYADPRYNGNIEGMVWKSKGDGEKRKYDFKYDNGNRLLRADFTQYNGTIFDQSAGVNYNVKIGDGVNPLSAYDANGNILKMQQWGWELTGSTQIDNMKYTYFAGSNKLKNVTDFNNNALTKLGDFKTNLTHPQNVPKSALTENSTPAEFDAISDYSYDVNGNLTADNNKAISSIIYNHLNLPAIIYLNNGDMDKNGNPVLDIITFTYDAVGNKLMKTVDDALGDVTVRKVTTYIGGVVYQDDTLQFISQEEGRIRFKPTNASFQYDYMLKDHLGNVRMVLTEEIQQDKYPAATLEDVTYNGGTAVSVESLYYNIDNSKIVPQSTATGIPTYQNNNGITNNNPYSNINANSARLYLLNATNNTVADKNGLGIVLKVMAGDAINIFGKSYHKMPGGGYSFSTNPLSVVDLMTLLAASPTVSGKGITGTQISNLPGFPTNVTNLLNNQPPQNSNRPRASINWIILDEQFKYLSGGFDMVETATNTSGSFKDHSVQGIAIPKNGYIYVYCSNESQYNVFFDNLQVVHDRGPILEESHYYPFGLTMSSISSKSAGSLSNKYKYNGKEEERQEFSGEAGLEMYDYGARHYDQQIGRWFAIDPLADKSRRWSPYVYANDNPIVFIDPDGMSSDYYLSQSTNSEMKIINQTGQEENEDWYAVLNPDGTISLYQNEGKTDPTRQNAGQTYTNVGGDGLTEGQAYANAKAILTGGGFPVPTKPTSNPLVPTQPTAGQSQTSSGYSFPWTTIGSTLAANASNFYFNPATKQWYSFTQNKFYDGTKFTHNPYTGGGMNAAKTTSNVLTGIGYGFGAYNAFSINQQYRSGQIGTGTMLAEQSSNVISTFGGYYGAAWGVGWEAGRAITSIPWYRQNIRPQIQDFFGWQRDEVPNRSILDDLH